MGRLVMSFRGLCIHLNRQRVPRLPDGVNHRVVAVAADKGAKTNKWGDLPAHICWLQANAPTNAVLTDAGLISEIAGVIRLQGVSISVRNAKRDQPVPQPLPDEVPRLKYYLDSMVLRPDLLEPGAPAIADSYVDITHGTLTATQFKTPSGKKGGYYTTWSVETEGLPELWLLRHGHPDPLCIQLPSSDRTDVFPDGVPGSMVLHNATFDYRDKKNDFVLNYLANANGIPDQFTRPFPTDGNLDDTVDGAIIGMSTSCSNSQYP